MKANKFDIMMWIYNHVRNPWLRSRLSQYIAKELVNAVDMDTIRAASQVWIEIWQKDNLI